MTNLIKSKILHQLSQPIIQGLKKLLVSNHHLKLRCLLAATTHSQARKKDNHPKDPNFHPEVQSTSPRCNSWSKTSKSSSCRGASSQNHSTIKGSCKAWFVLCSQSLWLIQWCGRRANLLDHWHSASFLPCSTNWLSTGSAYRHHSKVQNGILF